MENDSTLYPLPQPQPQQGALHAGARFDTIDDLKAAIAQHALSCGRSFRTQRSDKGHGLVIVCANVAPRAALAGDGNDVSSIGGGNGSDVANAVGNADAPPQTLPSLLLLPPGATWDRPAAAAEPKIQHTTRCKPTNRSCAFVVAAIQCDNGWIVKKFCEHSCAPTAAGVRLPRKMAEHVLKRHLLVARDGKGTLSALQGHSVTTSKRTAHRIAAEIKQEAAGGTLQEQLQAIPALLDREKALDNDTTAHWEVSHNAEGQCTFERCFIAWGWSKTFFNHSKRLAVLDAAHLSPEGSGTVLTAEGSDANGHVTVLAAAIVPKETHDDWIYFINHLRSHITELDSDITVIKSDRNPGLISAVRELLHHAQHSFCAIHIARNAIMHAEPTADRDAIRNLVFAASKALFPDRYNELLAGIQRVSPAVHKFLTTSLRPEEWVSCFLKAPQFEHATSNNAESMNAHALSARCEGPLATLLALREFNFVQARARLEEARQALARQQGLPLTTVACTALDEEAKLGAHMRGARSAATGQRPSSSMLPPTLLFRSGTQTSANHAPVGKRHSFCCRAHTS